MRDQVKNTAYTIGSTIHDSAKLEKNWNPIFSLKIYGDCIFNQIHGRAHHVFFSQNLKMSKIKRKYQLDQ